MLITINIQITSCKSLTTENATTDSGKELGKQEKNLSAFHIKSVVIARPPGFLKSHIFTTVLECLWCCFQVLSEMSA